MKRWGFLTGLLFAAMLVAGADSVPVPRPADLARDTDVVALRRAVESLARNPQYPNGKERLEQLSRYEKTLPALAAAVKAGDAAALKEYQAYLEFRRQALLDNPVVGFKDVVLVRRQLGDAARRAMGRELGLPTLNSHTNDTIARSGWNNQVAVLEDFKRASGLRTVFNSVNGAPISDLELHFDGDRIMFSSVGGEQKQWRLFEIRKDGSGLVQLSPDDGVDVGHFDSCYLPDGRIIFCSTANMVGLPCENGGKAMCSLYQLNPADKSIRQISFDQDSNWSPSVLNTGKVLYQRWEYADLPHSNSRLLMQMYPDGSAQFAYYGSGSYFPPSLFFARAVPNHPSMVMAIAGGHHGTPRSGRLLVIDPALGRHEADGVVQEIPGFGKKVEPIVRDRLVDGVWPQFLHPSPLDDKTALVACKPGPDSLWGIYLVDVYDNLLLLKEEEGCAFLDPIPLCSRPTPPVIADRIDPKKKTASVYIHNLYDSPGLKDVPPGTVKSIRLSTYYFSPRGTGGLLGTIGMDGPWDIKRIMGTVPVQPDGSCIFEIPANTSISLQPLDQEGRALQLMRSWFVGMPGEAVSCIGCHEEPNLAPTGRSIAGKQKPSPITPWHGPVRGFAFAREVQPILDRYCVACHNGQPHQGKPIPYLKGDKMITDWNSQISGHASPAYGGKFSQAYNELHRFVRRPGIESDLHMLAPLEFRADTTELIQMLKKGHHNVNLPQDAYERLYCWIDCNAPYWGTRGQLPTYGHIPTINARARELARKYAGVDDDYEIQPPEENSAPIVPVIPEPLPPLVEKKPVMAKGWPFTAQEAQTRQQGKPSKTIDLGKGVTMEMVYIPPGSFVMGNLNGARDEAPRTAVTIDKGFWMSKTEVTNAQFAVFSPTHDSRHEDRHGYQFGRVGYPANLPGQPVVRVSWNEAQAFCEWLGQTRKAEIRLPSEAQWEWACRAGAETPFFFGALEADYTKFANIGDLKLKEFAACTAAGGYTRAEIIKNPGPYDDWIPRDTRFDDGGFISEPVGRYQPNAWGLQDMHGNVAEWTSSLYQPYPYRTAAEKSGSGLRVVRGGSWYDRPFRCTSSFRLAYDPWQKVFNVGFRVIMKDTRH